MAAVLLFPHAGSGAAPYIRLTQAFGDSLDVGVVRLPGRENRFAEPPITDMAEAVDCVTEALLHMDIGPLALFGHCSGAWLALETARALADRRMEPLCLYVSASVPPHHPPAELVDGGDEELITFLAADGYTSSELLGNLEFARVAFRILRADLTMIRNHTHVDRIPLACPLVAWYGKEDDPAIRSSAREWGLYTSDEFQMHELPGAHFSLWAEDSPLFHQLQRHLRDLVRHR